MNIGKDTRSGARHGRKICALCGKSGADTSDHVVPACFFAALPENVLTVPAHRACNGATSKDETYVRDMLTWCSPTARRSPEDTVRKAKVARAWEYDEKYRDAVKREMIVLPGNWGAFPYDPRRLTRVLVKICRGLWFDRFNEPMTNEGRWNFVRCDMTMFLEPKADEEHAVEPMIVRWSRKGEHMAASICIFGDHFFAGASFMGADGERFAWP